MQVNWPNGDFSITSGFEICVPDKASLLTCHWRLHLGAPMWLYHQHLQWTVLYNAESATSTLPSAWITSLPTRLSKACITVISMTKSISSIITRHFKSLPLNASAADNYLCLQPPEPEESFQLFSENCSPIIPPAWKFEEISTSLTCRP